MFERQSRHTGAVKIVFPKEGVSVTIEIVNKALLHLISQATTQRRGKPERRKGEAGRDGR